MPQHDEKYDILLSQMDYSQVLYLRIDQLIDFME